MFYSMVCEYIYFTANEKDIVFRRVETIWGISEQSSTSSSQTTKLELN